MKLYYDDLIDRYNLQQLLSDEIELFYLAIEYSKELREEFSFYLKMKFFLLDEEYKQAIEWLSDYKLINNV